MWDMRGCYALRPTYGLASVLMLRPMSPELVLLPDFWVSNIPRWFCFCFIAKKAHYKSLIQGYAYWICFLKKKGFCHVSEFYILLNFSPWIPLGTFSILLCSIFISHTLNVCFTDTMVNIMSPSDIGYWHITLFKLFIKRGPWKETSKF